MVVGISFVLAAVQMAALVRACEVVLYSDCFGGHTVQMQEGVHGLHDHPWYIGDSVSSIKVHGFGCMAELHPDSLEDGQPWYFPEGIYDCNTFSYMAGQDSASVVRVYRRQEPCGATLYGDCFSGHEVTVGEGVHGLHDHPWYIGDSVSSIRVHGFGCMAELHPDSLEDGQPWYFPEGAYPCDTFSHMAGQDSASVIRVYRRHNLEACGITLYSDCFSGHEVTIGEGYHNLHEHPWYIGDSVSSVRVHGFGCVAELHPDSFEDGQSWYIPQGDYDCDKFGAMAAHDSASVLLVYRAQP